MKCTKTKSKMAAIFEYHWHRQPEAEFLSTRPRHIQDSCIVCIPPCTPMSKNCISINYSGKYTELGNRHFGCCLATRNRKAKILIHSPTHTTNSPSLPPSFPPCLPAFLPSCLPVCRLPPSLTLTHIHRFMTSSADLWSAELKTPGHKEASSNG